MEDYDSLRISLKKVVEQRIKRREKTKDKKADKVAAARKNARLEEAPSRLRTESFDTQSDPSLAWSCRSKSRDQSKSNDQFAVDVDVGSGGSTYSNGNLGTPTSSGRSVTADPFQAELLQAEPDDLKSKVNAQTEANGTVNGAGAADPVGHSAKGVVPAVGGGDAHAAFAGSQVEALLRGIDQTLSTLVLQQSVLARRVTQIERTIKKEDGGTTPGRSHKFNPRDVRDLLRGLTDSGATSLGSLRSGHSSMVLSDDFSQESSSSGEDDDDAAEEALMPLVVHRSRSLTDVYMEGAKTSPAVSPGSPASPT